jgi:TIR domain
MKVFISWSGERSKAVAQALHDWLPNVIQAVQPWMSESDIDKGSRWRTGLASELEQANVGIICLTPENLKEPWINFEAGALSKQQDNTYVCTLLYQLEPINVEEPLAQFQATRAVKDDVMKLILTINRTLGDSSLSDQKLREAFEVWWPRLESALDNIASPEQILPQRETREVLEEILGLLREQSRGAAAIWSNNRSQFTFPGSWNLNAEEAQILTDNILNQIAIAETALSDRTIAKALLDTNRQNPNTLETLTKWRKGLDMSQSKKDNENENPNH